VALESPAALTPVALEAPEGASLPWQPGRVLLRGRPVPSKPD
jgi:hypothetical protein